MNQPIVIIESPYAGDTEKHTRYVRAALRDALHRGESPLASHALYTLPGVLDDAEPSEREMGMTAGFRWYRIADRCVVYTDCGISHGMHLGIGHAKVAGLAISYRTLGPDWDRNDD